MKKVIAMLLIIVVSFFLVGTLHSTAMANSYWVNKSQGVTMVVATSPSATVLIVMNPTDTDITIELTDITFKLRNNTVVTAPFCLFELMGGLAGTANQSVTASKNGKTLAVLRTLPMSNGVNFIVDNKLVAVFYRGTNNFNKVSHKQCQSVLDQFTNLQGN